MSGFGGRVLPSLRYRFLSLSYSVEKNPDIDEEWLYGRLCDMLRDWRKDHKKRLRVAMDTKEPEA